MSDNRVSHILPARLILVCWKHWIAPEIKQAVEMMMQTAWVGILGHDRAEFFTIVV